VTQERVQRQKAKVRAEDTHIDESNVDATNAELAQSTDQTLESIDEALEDQVDEELLSFMDDVLEEDAEQFVNNYIQKGGE
jgi:ubiquitin-like protein Pup